MENCNIEDAKLKQNLTHDSSTRKIIDEMILNISIGKKEHPTFCNRNIYWKCCKIFVVSIQRRKIYTANELSQGLIINCVKFQLKFQPSYRNLIFSIDKYLFQLVIYC